MVIWRTRSSRVLFPAQTLGNIRVQAHRRSPALVAATHQVILLHAVRQELRPAEGQADVGEQLGQAGPPLIPVVPDPGQHGLKDLP